MVETSFLDIAQKKYSFSDSVDVIKKVDTGLMEDTVKEISKIKNEPKWMLEFRLNALKIFKAKPMPNWGADLSALNFDNIIYYAASTEKTSNKWDEVPEKIKQTFERLGIPEAERKFLAGAGAMYESETVYHKLREDLEKQGVIFLDMDTALKEHEELVKKYFSTVVPAGDNKFAALNSAFWSGGSFVYVPKGVKVDKPLQAYFRINKKNMGQFERTLIIVDESAEVHYLEGCSAPSYSTDSLHAAVVEVIAHKNSRVRYTTLQNWSSNVYNLVTKRAVAHENAYVEWLDANVGCLAKGTKIFTKDNIKNIENIKVGDLVYSLNEDMNITPQSVIAKRINVPTDVYKLITSNYREIVATKNHPFLILRKEGKLSKISWMPLEDIKEKDLIAISGVIPDHGYIYKINFQRAKKIIVPTETSEDLMWLLGFYIGDGFIDKARLCFAVPETDKSNKKIKELLKNLFKVDYVQYKDMIRINSADLVKFIKDLGFTGNARNKNIPNWVYNLPQNQKLSFIIGYIDADGHIKKGHKNISLCSVNKKLLEDTKILAISCGLNPTKISKWIRKEKKPLGKKSKIYQHYFLYFSDEKLSKVNFVRIIKKEYIGKEKTYDIEVENTSNFIANGIFAHNSKVTMKYPCVVLKGEKSNANILSVAFANNGQVQDTGAKAIHMAPNTTSKIISKSVSKNGGASTYRGLLHVAKNAKNSKGFMRCDALILDDASKADAIPSLDVNENDVSMGHEATVGKISREQTFYLMSRGLTEEQATTMIVAGFFEEFTKTLPLEYAVEFNRLINMEMAGSVG